MKWPFTEITHRMDKGLPVVSQESSVNAVVMHGCSYRDPW